MCEGSPGPGGAVNGGEKERWESLPSALKDRAECRLLEGIPSLLVHPEGHASHPPLFLWLHGRTAWKELDPGRYLRLMRAGIAVCAIDLPGHGARCGPTRQTPDEVLGVVIDASEEIDRVQAAAITSLNADPARCGIGGMSAGGMAVLARLCRPHTFQACALEATSGDWDSVPMRSAGTPSDQAMAAELNPIRHLDQWRPIPMLSVHAKLDAWIPYAGQSRFLDHIQDRYPQAEIERVVYDRTGAEAEHVGFGLHAADAKQRQCEFLIQHLKPSIG